MHYKVVVVMCRGSRRNILNDVGAVVDCSSVVGHLGSRRVLFIVHRTNVSLAVKSSMSVARCPCCIDITNRKKIFSPAQRITSF